MDIDQSNNKNKDKDAMEKECRSVSHRAQSNPIISEVPSVSLCRQPPVMLIFTNARPCRAGADAPLIQGRGCLSQTLLLGHMKRFPTGGKRWIRNGPNRRCCHLYLLSPWCRCKKDPKTSRLFLTRVDLKKKSTQLKYHN